MEISEIADLAEEEEVSTPALYGQVHAFKRLMRQAGFVDGTKHKRNGAMTDYIEKDPTRSKDVKRVTRSPDAISSNRGMGARAPCPAESWRSMEWCTSFTQSLKLIKRTQHLKHWVRRWLKKGKAQGFVTVPFSSALSNFG